MQRPAGAYMTWQCRTSAVTWWLHAHARKSGYGIPEGTLSCSGLPCPLSTAFALPSPRYSHQLRPLHLHGTS